MAEVLIDANIFLDFYLTEQIGKFIDLLDEVKDNVLITEQVYNEVERNKLNVAKQHLEKTHQKSCPLFSVQYHLLSCSVEEREELREQVNQFNKQAQDLYSKIETTYSTLLREIAESTDHVSRSLMRLFRNRLQPTEAEFAKARLRKELGNPPGKSGDRLGDQVTWEQFLSRASAHNKVWIITRDGDYFLPNQDKSLMLNPVLYRELRALNANIEIKCFSKLSEGIKDYTSQLSARPAHIPTDREFEALRHAEDSLAAETRSMPIMPVLPVVRCSGTGKEHSFIDDLRPSRYGGGLSWHQRCTSCGLLIDTGDYAD